MADERARVSWEVDPRRKVARKQAEFQEAPGEVEAEAVSRAFLQRASRDPEGISGALDNADGATRTGVIHRLQRERGNAYVQRVVEEAQGSPGRLVGASQGEMVGEVRERQDAGNPLPDSTRGDMEGFFGTNLEGVRVHTGSEAQSLNRELNAQAFTVGSDIFFGEGKYDPGSREGQGLLAHELTHVGQQGGFGDTGVQREALEEEEVQRQELPEEEEEVQRQAVPEEEEEPLQA